MNNLFLALGISKQAFHQKLGRSRTALEQQHNLIQIIRQIRQDHPTLSIRTMYYMIKPEGMGRDKFELMCNEEGLSISRPKNYRRTTDSTGVKRFIDLVTGLEVTRINQVWQSDITYFEINKRFYYITFIIDAYSRVIVGYSVSKSLKTVDTTVSALQKGLLYRGVDKLPGLILHSDGGGQYYAEVFLSITSQAGICNSMCEFAWENGKAERINGIIKNNYLKYQSIKTFTQLVESVDRSVSLYNEQRPHTSLQRKTPLQFEKELFLFEENDPTMISQRRNKNFQQRGVSALRAEGKQSSESISLKNKYMPER